MILVTSLWLACKQASTTISPASKVSIPTTTKTADQSSLKPMSPFSLVHKIREPKNKTAQSPLLILMHGLGSNEQDLYSLAPGLDERLMVVSARAPITIGDNKYSWFDLQRTAQGFDHNEEQTLKALSLVNTFINELKVEYKLDPDQIFVGGFSQGAIMSLGMALLYPEQIDGAISLSGAVYPEFIAHKKGLPQGKEIVALVTHGRQDLVLPIADIQKALPKLKESGLTVTTKWYDSAHTISQENYNDLRFWLTRVLNK